MGGGGEVASENIFFSVFLFFVRVRALKKIKDAIYFVFVFPNAVV